MKKRKSEPKVENKDPKEWEKQWRGKGIRGYSSCDEKEVDNCMLEESAEPKDAVEKKGEVWEYRQKKEGERSGETYH